MGSAEYDQTLQVSSTFFQPFLLCKTIPRQTYKLSPSNNKTWQMPQRTARELVYSPKQSNRKTAYTEVGVILIYPPPSVTSQSCVVVAEALNLQAETTSFSFPMPCIQFQLYKMGPGKVSSTAFNTQVL